MSGLRPIIPDSITLSIDQSVEIIKRLCKPITQTKIDADDIESETFCDESETKLLMEATTSLRSRLTLATPPQFENILHDFLFWNPQDLLVPSKINPVYAYNENPAQETQILDCIMFLIEHGPISEIRQECSWILAYACSTEDPQNSRLLHQHPRIASVLVETMMKQVLALSTHIFLESFVEHTKYANQTEWIRELQKEELMNQQKVWCGCLAWGLGNLAADGDWGLLQVFRAGGDQALIKNIEHALLLNGAPQMNNLVWALSVLLHPVVFANGDDDRSPKDSRDFASLQTRRFLDLDQKVFVQKKIGDETLLNNVELSNQNLENFDKKIEKDEKEEGEKNDKVEKENEKEMQKEMQKDEREKKDESEMETETEKVEKKGKKEEKGVYGCKPEMPYPTDLAIKVVPLWAKVLDKHQEPSIKNFIFASIEKQLDLISARRVRPNDVEAAEKVAYAISESRGLMNHFSMSMKSFSGRKGPSENFVEPSGNPSEPSRNPGEPSRNTSEPSGNPSEPTGNPLDRIGSLLKIVGSMVTTDGSSITDRCIESGLVDQVIGLLGHSHSGVRCMACFVLANVAGGTFGQREYLMRHPKFLPALADLVRFGIATNLLVEKSSFPSIPFVPSVKGHLENLEKIDGHLTGVNDSTVMDIDDVVAANNSIYDASFVFIDVPDSVDVSNGLQQVCQNPPNLQKEGKNEKEEKEEKEKKDKEKKTVVNYENNEKDENMKKGGSEEKEEKEKKEKKEQKEKKEKKEQLEWEISRVRHQACYIVRNLAGSQKNSERSYTSDLVNSGIVKHLCELLRGDLKTSRRGRMTTMPANLHQISKTLVAILINARAFFDKGEYKKIYDEIKRSTRNLLGVTRLYRQRLTPLKKVLDSVIGELVYMNDIFPMSDDDSSFEEENERQAGDDLRLWGT